MTSLLLMCVLLAPLSGVTIAVGGAGGVDVFPAVMVYGEDGELTVALMSIHTKKGYRFLPVVPGTVDPNTESAQYLSSVWNNRAQIVSVQAWRGLKEPLGPYLERMDALDGALIASGWEAVSSRSRGGETGPPNIGSSTQVLETTLRKTYGHDNQGNPIIRERVLKTWRRSGEHLQKWIKRHDEAEEGMIQAGWT